MTRSRDTGNVGYRAYKKNYLINGSFDIWQRGNLFNPVVNNAYLADRFFTQTSEATPFGAISRASVRANYPDAFGSYLLNMSLTGMVQPVDDAQDRFYAFDQWVESGQQNLSGKTVTMSVELDTDANSFGMSFYSLTELTGYGYVKFDVADGVDTGRGTKLFSTTTTLPNLPDGNLLCVFIIANNTHHAETLGGVGASKVVLSGTYMNVLHVQLEEGSVATEFEYSSYGEELALCQRYYQTNDVMAYTAYVNVADINNVHSFEYPVTMRATPSVVFSNQNYTNSKNLTTNAVNNSTLRTQFLSNGHNACFVTFLYELDAEL